MKDKSMLKPVCERCNGHKNVRVRTVIGTGGWVEKIRLCEDCRKRLNAGPPHIN